MQDKPRRVRSPQRPVRGAGRASRVVNGTYLLTADERAHFHEHGYATLRSVFREEELADFERVFDEFAAGSRPVPLRDYGDHSQGHGVPKGNWNMVNVNVPTAHDPAWSGNLVERRCHAIANQLFPNLVKDYDQILVKLPSRPGAVFPWHQDQAYWPKLRTPRIPTSTVTCSLALNRATGANGCLRVLPGTHRPLGLERPHTRHGTHYDAAGDARALEITLTPAEERRVVELPVERGDVTLHNEFIVHGSGGNTLPVPRKTFVVAFRDAAMVRYERELGFTHSYTIDPKLSERIRFGIFE